MQKLNLCIFALMLSILIVSFVVVEGSYGQIIQNSTNGCPKGQVPVINGSISSLNGTNISQIKALSCKSIDSYNTIFGQ